MLVEENSNFYKNFALKPDVSFLSVQDIYRKYKALVQLKLIISKFMKTKKLS